MTELIVMNLKFINILKIINNNKIYKNITNETDPSENKKQKGTN